MGLIEYLIKSSKYEPQYSNLKVSVHEYSTNLGSKHVSLPTFNCHLESLLTSEACGETRQ
jgi:hypothetical protein